jgi:hypothetical protein
MRTVRAPLRRHLDGVALVGQYFGQRFAELGLVLDQKDLEHRRTSRSRPLAAAIS